MSQAGVPTVAVLPFAPAVTRARVLHWSGQGLWAVLDQALFAAGNLIVNVLLARWLPPAEYGAFVTAYTVLLLISVFHTAFLSEPMLVFGAQQYRGGFGGYFAVLRRYHWRVTLASSVMAAAAGAALYLAGATQLGAACAGVAVMTPCVLLAWLARRACYAVSKPARAAAGGGVSLALVVVGTALLARWDMLSVMAAQLLLCASALAASAVMVVPTAAGGPIEDGARPGIWKAHWEYGRWSSGTGLLIWSAGYLYYLILPFAGGLEASGGLKAISNLVMPVLQSDAALITLLTPLFARAHRQHGRLGSAVSVAMVAFAVEALLYWCALVLFGHQVMAWFYGGAYAVDTYVLVLLGTLPLLNGMSNVCGTALRVRQQTDKVFWATTVSVIAGLGVGLTAVRAYGVPGAVLGLSVGAAVQVMAMLWMFLRPIRTSPCA